MHVHDAPPPIPHPAPQRCEWLPTSIELFRRGYRSVYVNEMGETLSSCFDETTRLHVRVQELFDVHHTATEVLFSDPLGLLKARYTTGRHRLFIIEDLWQGLFTVMRGRSRGRGVG